MSFKDFLDDNLPDANYSTGEKSKCVLFRIASLFDF